MLLFFIIAVSAKIECELTDKQIHQLGRVFYITDYTVHKSASGVSRRELQDYCLSSGTNHTLQWASCYECNPIDVADQLDKNMIALWMMTLCLIVLIALGLLYKPYFMHLFNGVCTDKPDLEPEVSSSMTNQKKLIPPHEQTMAKK